jgi:D-glycero-beta-D-manno-heptose-7-phosphate kinase
MKDGNLSNAFNRFRHFRALVIGDFVLDAYTTGRVKRISPEAPVQVLEVLKQESRPGGAGNAALNLIALGGSVIAMGRIGSDEDGAVLKKRLSLAGADVRGLLVEPAYRTPVKTRFIADSQQLLRVDQEIISEIDPAIEKEIILQLETAIPAVEIVAISDYGKGFLSNRIIQEAIAIARRLSVSCIVDPKGTDFTKYRGASLLKPNLSEAYAAAKMPPSAPLESVAEQIFETTNVDRLLITRSEAGMTLFDREKGRSDFPVRSKEVKDVTGAGDTVLAMMSLGMASGLDLSLTLQLANIAAGLSIERLGCVQVRLSEVAERLLETDCESKIFDEVHTYALQQVLSDKLYTLLVLERAQAITKELMRTIQKLRQNKTRELILYIRDCHPEGEFVHLLSFMQDIKAIILQKESLKTLCDAIQPQEVFFFDGEKVKEAKDLLSLLLNSTHQLLV